MKILTLNECKQDWSDRKASFKSPFPEKTMELSYFKNRSGLIAVSCDYGDHIILPSGKTMEFNDFWEDVDSDHRSDLTPVQEASLKRALERFNATPVGDIVRSYSRNRKIQERLNGTEPIPERRVLSEDVLVVVADFD